MSDTEGTELDPLVGAPSKPPIGELHSLNLDTTERYSVQDILDQSPFNRYDCMYLVSLGFVSMAESLQLAYIAIILPFLT